MDSVTPFRILPWDFFAGDNAPSPHIEALQISGAPRVFELLKRGSRVYFRLHDDTSRAWATLDDEGDTDFVRTFRRAIGSGRIGRVFERRHWHIYRPTYEQIGLFHFLIGAHGELQMRAWCDSHWFVPDLEDEMARSVAKSLARSNLGVFHPKWNPHFKTDRLLRFNWPTAHRPDERTKSLVATRWVRGDARTFDRLLAPLLWTGAVRAHRIHEGTLYCDFDAHLAFLSPAPTTYDRVLSRQIPAPMSDIIDNHFCIAGVDWAGDPMHPTPPYYQTYGPSHTVQTTANPTAHERLEAHLFLRDWLQGKLAPAQISDVLQSIQH